MYNTEQISKQITLKSTLTDYKTSITKQAGDFDSRLKLQVMMTFATRLATPAAEKASVNRQSEYRLAPLPLPASRAPLNSRTV